MSARQWANIAGYFFWLQNNSVTNMPTWIILWFASDPFITHLSDTLVHESHIREKGISPTKQVLDWIKSYKTRLHVHVNFPFHEETAETEDGTARISIFCR